jgi:hypothetical protein
MSRIVKSDVVTIGAIPVEISYVNNDIDTHAKEFNVSFKLVGCKEEYIFDSYSDRSQAQDRYLDIVWHPENYAIKEVSVGDKLVYQLERKKKKVKQ